jgi:hypothetical protein
MIQLVGSDFNAGIFLVVGSGVFTGLFEIFGVWLWWICGQGVVDWMGKGGFRTDRFLGAVDFAGF